MSRKSGKNTPTVISGVLYTNDERTGARLDHQIEWNGFLEDRESFYYTYGDSGFSVRGQHHRQGFFFYAYKRINGKLYKKYLGYHPKLADLEAMGAVFQALVK